MALVLIRAAVWRACPGSSRLSRSSCVYKIKVKSLSSHGVEAIERWSVTWRYHGNKIPKPQQYFFTETAICVWKKNMGYRFVPEYRKVFPCQFFRFFFFAIFAGPGSFRSRNFATIATRRNNFSSPWRRQRAISLLKNNNNNINIKRFGVFLSHAAHLGGQILGRK